MLVPVAVETAPKSGSRITEASVRGHMDFLASDALNGRGSGTRDEWLAATYIASEMRRWGIEPLGDAGGYVQDVSIERSEVAAPPVLSFEGRRLTHGQEISVSRLGGGTVSGPLQRYSPGVTVAKGAVLLLPEGSAAPAADTAAASIVISAETDQARERRLAAPSRPLTMQHIAGVPARAVVVAGRDAYAALSKAADGVVITLDTVAKPATIAHTWNAIGRLTGRSRSEAGEAILLTAHLDHLGNRLLASGAAAGADTIFNGADDDASGSVAVLELAEAIAMGKRPRRSVIFAWFGSEESGGAGAAHFIDAPPVPLDKIITNLEFEMIGRADTSVPAHTLWLTGYERSNLGPSLARRGARIVADPHPAQNFFFRSDNIQLARRGVIAQTVSSFGLHTDYHQPSDELRTIDFAHMTDAIRSMLDPILWLANSRFKPEWLAGKKP